MLWSGIGAIYFEKIIFAPEHITYMQTHFSTFLFQIHIEE